MKYLSHPIKTQELKFTSQTIYTHITFQIIPTKTVPIRQGLPPKITGPQYDTTKPGNQGGNRMLTKKEPHVYELILPEDFDHAEVIKVRSNTIRIELRYGSQSD